MDAVFDLFFPYPDFLLLRMQLPRWHSKVASVLILPFSPPPSPSAIVFHRVIKSRAGCGDGDSGGPVVDSRTGRLVGLVSQVWFLFFPFRCFRCFRLLNVLSPFYHVAVHYLSVIYFLLLWIMPAECEFWPLNCGLLDSLSSRARRDTAPLTISAPWTWHLSCCRGHSIWICMCKCINRTYRCST